MKSKKTVCRQIPCPLYDMESCESWLAYMAGKGLFLERWGRYTAVFRPGPPQAVRYRLTAARLKGLALFSAPSVPDAAEAELYAASGWEFVCAREEFFFYCCKDPHAPELHTDPVVQAISLKMAVRSALYVFAIVGIYLFRLPDMTNATPEMFEALARLRELAPWPTPMQEEPYANLSEAIFTLVRCMSGDAWSDVRYHLCAASRLGLLDVPEIVITGYHIVWYILAAFLLINVIIGAVISNFESAMREKRKQQERAEREERNRAERAQRLAAARLVATQEPGTTSAVGANNVVGAQGTNAPTSDTGAPAPERKS